jgi:hypothetical protein
MKNKFFINRLMRKSFSLVSMVAMIALVGTSQAKADEYGRIDREARRVERMTKTLLNETSHYKNTANYGVMVDSALQLKSLAAHVHDVARLDGSLAHLKHDIAELERNLCIVEDLMDQTELNASRGYGCVKGNTRHVKRLLERIDKSICKMQKELECLCRRLETERVVYQPVVVKQVVPVVVRPRVTTVDIEVSRYNYQVPDFDRYATRSHWLDLYGSGCPSRRHR